MASMLNSRRRKKTEDHPSNHPTILVPVTAPYVYRPDQILDFLVKFEHLNIFLLFKYFVKPALLQFNQRNA
jgi:hypothetical protein